LKEAVEKQNPALVLKAETKYRTAAQVPPSLMIVNNESTRAKLINKDTEYEESVYDIFALQHDDMAYRYPACLKSFVEDGTSCPESLRFKIKEDRKTKMEQQKEATKKAKMEQKNLLVAQRAVAKAVKAKMRQVAVLQRVVQGKAPLPNVVAAGAAGGPPAPAAGAGAGAQGGAGVGLIPKLAGAPGPVVKNANAAGALQAKNGNNAGAAAGGAAGGAAAGAVGPGAMAPAGGPPAPPPGNKAPAPAPPEEEEEEDEEEDD
jgi:hypothetical protein